jgi:hypothetical protein
MIPDKIRPQHLDRRAILYGGRPQSSGPAQSRERALQYAMRERLTALGWSD